MSSRVQIQHRNKPEPQSSGDAWSYRKFQKLFFVYSLTLSLAHHRCELALKSLQHLLSLNHLAQSINLSLPNYQPQRKYQNSGVAQKHQGFRQHSNIDIYLNGYSRLWIINLAGRSKTIQSQDIWFMKCRNIGYDHFMSILRSSQFNILKSGIAEIGNHGNRSRNEI